MARILKDLNYRLRVNHKRVSAGSGPDRDQQFQYIAEQRAKFAGRALPIVSIDTKKREPVGNFKNPGSGWAKTPQAVNDHDFRSQADGIAIPYGVYDVTANRGFVVVGTSHDTPDFAADNSWSNGGTATASNATARPQNCWCSPTPAAATRRAFAASSMLSRPASLIRTSSPLPSVTTPAAPPSGTPSTTACSARSARTGLATRCAATGRSSTTSVPPPPTPGCA